MAPLHQDLAATKLQDERSTSGIAHPEERIPLSRQDVFDPNPFAPAGQPDDTQAPLRKLSHPQEQSNDELGSQDAGDRSVRSTGPGDLTVGRIKPLPPIPSSRLSSPVASHNRLNTNEGVLGSHDTSYKSSKQRPPPLLIPDSPILGQPLFSSYPVVTARRRSSAASQPPSSYKGKERELYPAYGPGVEDSVVTHTGHSTMSDHFPAGLDHGRLSRGGAQGVEGITPEGRRGSASRIPLGPPLSHSAHFARPLPSYTVMNPIANSQRTDDNDAFRASTPRRQRAMTLEQHSPTMHRDPSTEARRRSVDQAVHGIANHNPNFVPGWLPPGALPAVNPASSASFELTAKSQYDALGVDRMGSPVSVIRVAGFQAASGPDESASDHRRASPVPVDAKQQHEPYTWANTSDPLFTLQSISTIAAGVPLVSPAPSQRTSNVGGDFFASKTLLPGSLGLTDESHLDAQDVSSQSKMNLSALKIVTSRSPQLDRSEAVTQSPTQFSPEIDQGGFVDQRMSMPSMTETSSGAGTAEVLLSSASTSLSRSTKNGRDGKDREKASTDGDVQILQDQHRGITDQLARALENKIDTRKKRVDQRKYILVELVETEMAYTDHLRDLVHIYLPQLAALSIVTPVQHTVISRNLKEMLYFHEQLTNRMVDVLKEEGLGTDTQNIPGIDEGVRVERIARKVAAVFVEDASGFDMYDKYCSGSAAAMNIIREVQHRPEWSAFEKRCRIVIATRSNITLQQVLAEDNHNFRPELMPPPTVSSIPSRLMLRDLLILPVQRICRYSLVLSTLVSTWAPPSPAREGLFHLRSELDVGVDIERALDVMQESAARANIANQRSTVLARTATIARRLDYHPIVTRSLLANLGPCVLSGSLDTLYHNPTVAPLQTTVKVRYMGAFLYYGFLILAKIKKAEHYEIKHYLPLQMFEMVDVTEGFLPHSIRLTFRDHHMELAAACAEEKDVWAAALCEARDNATISPFDLPCSIAYGAGRARRESAYQPSESVPPSATTPKRYSLALLDFNIHAEAPRTAENFNDYGREVPEPPRSPVMPSSPMRREGIPLQTPSSILMRRASPLYRHSIDSNLQDVISDECNIARASGRQFSNDSFGIQPVSVGASGQGIRRNRLSMSQSSVLRRRRSYVDVQSSPSTDTIESTQTITNNFGRTMSGYGNNVASSFKRGFSASSHDGRLSKRSSIGSLETSGQTATDASSTVTERPVSFAGAWPSPPRRNHRTLSDDTAKTLALQSVPPQASQETFKSHARGQSDIVRRRSMQNLTSLLKPKHARASSVPVSPILDKTALSGSETDHDGSKAGAPESLGSGTTTPSHVGDYTTNPVDIFALGAGLTNVLYPAPAASKSGLLTRTFSYASQRRSKTSLFGGEIPFSASRRGSLDPAKAIAMSPITNEVKLPLASVPGSPAGSLTKLATTAPQNFASIGDQVSQMPTTAGITSLSTSPENVSEPSLSSKSPASTASDSGSTNISDIENTSSNVVNQHIPPKRRRSIRFFHRLNQFTTLSGSSSNGDK
ncbi:hypothetical protein NliqN6_5072 [Naganishia liquefaciens]|uniref:DH domain-containing protein n=1 Tax=Naganishia liquefaciens TaxID=104408 RepID=A0A8H3TWT9_9TREE|nr:hypothetical protein NliqN6_5072 [Naganishia liquefaciens]